MCAPTCDGTLITTDVYTAFQKGAASGVAFIIGITSGELQVFRSVVDGQDYKDAITAAVDNLKSCEDASIADAVREYIETETTSSNALEAKSKLVEQLNAVSVYRSAVKLAAGGSQVHLLYWDKKALIVNLGSGTVDVVATLLGNEEALQMYGSIMDADLSEILQSLLQKFISGDALELYRNEIAGIDSFVWKAFPQALIVSDGIFQCNTIEDRITELKALFDYMVH